MKAMTMTNITMMATSTAEPSESLDIMFLLLFALETNFDIGPFWQGGSIDGFEGYLCVFLCLVVQAQRNRALLHVIPLAFDPVGLLASV